MSSDQLPPNRCRPGTTPVNGPERQSGRTTHSGKPPIHHHVAAPVPADASTEIRLGAHAHNPNHPTQTIRGPPTKTAARENISSTPIPHPA